MRRPARDFDELTSNMRIRQALVKELGNEVVRESELESFTSAHSGPYWEERRCQAIRRRFTLEMRTRRTR